MSFYPLVFSSFGAEERKVLHEVVDSDLFTMGPRVAAFEQAFADYFSTRHAVMVNSGSSANLAAVAALFCKRERPLQRGDEVIVPAIAWSTTYHPLQQYGLKCRFVDIELDTLNMDVSRLAEALTPRTRMIVGVSILGNPAALDVMRRFADAHDLYFLEDNCESCDASLHGRKTGTFGDMGTFSFFFSHHISTMEGGMVITDDTELAHCIRAIRAHGWSRDLPHDSPIYERGNDDHFEAYRFLMPGYNLRPGEMHGAVGLSQLKKMPASTAQRRKNMVLFQQLFGNDERFIIQRENGESSSFCFTIILNPALKISRVQTFDLLRGADIDFRIITGGCFPRHDAIRYYDYTIVGDLERANVAHDYGFFVGNSPADLSVQIRTLRKVLDQVSV